jgi:hypothetical protein
MKKFFGMLAIVAALFVVSCGPSAKEVEEKRIADSIATADSIAALQISDSTLVVPTDDSAKPVSK